MFQKLYLSIKEMLEGKDIILETASDMVVFATLNILTCLIGISMNVIICVGILRKPKVPGFLRLILHSSIASTLYLAIRLCFEIAIPYRNFEWFTDSAPYVGLVLFYFKTLKRFFCIITMVDRFLRVMYLTESAYPPKMTYGPISVTIFYFLPAGFTYFYAYNSDCDYEYFSYGSVLTLPSRECDLYFFEMGFDFAFAFIAAFYVLLISAFIEAFSKSAQHTYYIMDTWQYQSIFTSLIYFTEAMCFATFILDSRITPLPSCHEIFFLASYYPILLSVINSSNDLLMMNSNKVVERARKFFLCCNPSRVAPS